MKAGKLAMPGFSSLKPPVQNVVRSGIEWIALNDDPETLRPLPISYNISVALLADITGLNRLAIATEVVKLRNRIIAKKRRDLKKLENAMKIQI